MHVFKIFVFNLDRKIILALELSFQSSATCYIFEFEGAEEDNAGPALEAQSPRTSYLQLQWTVPYRAVFASSSITRSHGSVK